jgi:hypothetical protein
MLGGLWSITRSRTLPLEKKLSEFKTFDQKYKNSSNADLEQLIILNTRKTNVYKKLHLTSRIAIHIENISQSLLEGVWLSDLDIRYESARDAGQKEAGSKPSETKIYLTLKGYSYNEKLNRQISLIEEFLGKLRLNSFLKKYSKMIELKQVKKETLDDFPVTYFEIMIETDEPHA